VPRTTTCTSRARRTAAATTRELLDLFEVAEDPATGKAAVIYSDTTMATWTGPDGTVHQLPEIVLAYEK
jgi:predicted PhzF superfamily epimerase YddE/YHI9